MICPKCGNEMPDGGPCDKCGEPVVISESMMTSQRMPFPPELKIGNNTAFFFNWIWAFTHKLWNWGIILFISAAVYKIVLYLGTISSVFYIIGFLLLIGHIILIAHFHGKANELAWNNGSIVNVERFLKFNRISTKFINFGIVIFILFFLYVVSGIPQNARMMGKVKYNRCLQALSSLKVAEEMYLYDNKGYADNKNLERLGMYMIPDCTKKDGCGNVVDERMKRNCQDFEIKLSNNGLDYQITGTAMDRNRCKICVTPTGFAPERYDSAGCANMVCP
jgi:hypothetical protein